MSAIIIRDAVPDDLPAIRVIYEDAVLYGTASFELTPPDEVEWRRRFDTLVGNRYPFIVAENGEGVLTGYAYAGPFRSRPAYRWSCENSVYIRPEAKGTGVGTALLSRLIEMAAEKGFRQMIAVIGGSDHAASLRLHERAGFEMIGTFRNSGFKHGKWLDTVLMQMRLGEGSDTPPDMDRYPGTLFTG